MSKMINVFISHAGEDEKYVEKVKEMLVNRKFVVRDSSVVESEPNKAKNEDYIKSLLRDKITWAGEVIVLIGKNTQNSEWIKGEIEVADRVGEKRIIGVFLPGSTNSDLPDTLNNYADAIVPWDASKLSAAIDGEMIWNDCDGNDRQRSGDPVTC